MDDSSDSASVPGLGPSPPLPQGSLPASTFHLMLGFSLPPTRSFQRRSSMPHPAIPNERLTDGENQACVVLYSESEVCRVGLAPGSLGTQRED